MIVTIRKAKTSSLWAWMLAAITITAARHASVKMSNR